MRKILILALCLLLTITTTSCQKTGPQSDPAQDIVTPKITISDDGYWVINGVKTEHKVAGQDGKDGVTPTIDVSEDGYLVINGVKSEHKVVGQDGKDGVTPTIEISEDGYLVINGIKTNYKATIDTPNPASLNEVAEIHKNSAPKKVVATVSQIINNTYRLDSNYELTNGFIDGFEASVFLYTKQNLSTPGSGYASPVYTVYGSREAIKGIGSRENGGVWYPADAVQTIKNGIISINFDVDILDDIVCETNVLSFTVPMENVNDVLDAEIFNGICSDVKVTICHDASVITSISLLYTSTLGGNFSEVETRVEITCSYDSQTIVIS